MATAKKNQPAATKKPTAKALKAAPAKAAKAPAPAAKPAVTPTKPIKAALNKTDLVAHVAQHSGVEPRAVKAVLGALEGAVLASVGKKAAGSFLLPGLLKITAVAVPAKKARKGLNPFTKQETVFKAKPATVKLRVRPLKKLKDAAL